LLWLLFIGLSQENKEGIKFLKIITKVVIFLCF